jgi:hypothetical protein
MIRKFVLPLIFMLSFIQIKAQQKHSFGYNGNIGTLKTELLMNLTISKDECVYTFEGTYFNKKLNKDLILKATLKPCENEKEDPDKKITFTEFDGDVITGTMILSGIGELTCSGTWISPNGKKKQLVKFVAIKDKEETKAKKK